MLVTRFKVATFNIHHCEGIDGLVDLPRTAEAIVATGAEVIALQEVDRGLERSGYADQPRLLAELTGFDVHFWPTVQIVDGQYGLALAATESLQTWFEPLPRVRSEEPRGLIVAAWRDFAIVATHLSTVREARAVQLEHLAQVVRDSALPVVVMGDLNLGPRHLGPLREAGLMTLPHPPKTFPSRWPRRRINHVLATPPLEVLEGRAPRTPASDHLPLVAEVQELDP